MAPISSSRCSRRAHCEGERATTSAKATLVMRPSRWSAARILRSKSSRSAMRYYGMDLTRFAAFPHDWGKCCLRKPGFAMHPALSLHDRELSPEDTMLAQAIRDEIRPDYTMDQPIERYTAADHEVWRRLFERQAATLQGRACDEFLDGLTGLGVAKEGIPSFDR